MSQVCLTLSLMSIIKYSDSSLHHTVKENKSNIYTFIIIIIHVSSERPGNRRTTLKHLN